eukprot:1158534-Pelagomonas_calceolata.AAC.8
MEAAGAVSACTTAEAALGVDGKLGYLPRGAHVEHSAWSSWRSMPCALGFRAVGAGLVLGYPRQ